MHTVVFPYFCDDEVDRYERILSHIASMGDPGVEYEFLLASSPRTEPSDRLYAAASAVAPTRVLRCPSQVFGYPQGASAMFWDCMEHVARDQHSQDDFVLWMESDMCPVRPEWMTRLDADWRASGDVFAMGLSIPDLYRTKREKLRFKHIIKRRTRREIKAKWISAHLNGGACYRRDLVHYVDAKFREGIFDMDLGMMFLEKGGFADTPLLAFSTLKRIGDDLHDPDKVVLHGYLQDKDLFLDACIAGPQPRSVIEEQRARWAVATARREPHASEPVLEAILRAKEPRLEGLRIIARREAAGIGRSITSNGPQSPARDAA